MCHIFTCITLSIDLMQRVITYVFACFLLILVFFLLLASLIAGMAYGYKYFLAEYHTNGFYPKMRKMSMALQTKLAEFDPKYYKDLRSYNVFMNTSTTTTTTPPSPKPRRLGGKYGPGFMTNFKVEDDVDENEIASDEVLIDRPTVSPADDKTESGIKDYVKKLNWVVATIHNNKTSDRQELNKRGLSADSNLLDDNAKLRYSARYNEKNTNFHKDPNRYSEYSGFPVWNVVPLRPMEPKSKSGRKRTEVTTSSTKDVVVTRPTVETSGGTTISETKLMTPTTKKSIVLDILQKRLMSVNKDTTNVQDNRASSTNVPPKQYMQILNYLLSQKNNLTSSTDKEEIILV